MASLKIEIGFVTQTCSNCGTVSAVTDVFAGRRRMDHKIFYCPNGHAHHYQALSDVEIAVNERNAAQATANEARHAMLVAQKERDELAEAKRKLEDRIFAGVCPCCNRTFSNLHRHMEAKHPDRAVGAGKNRKGIAA